MPNVFDSFFKEFLRIILAPWGSPHVGETVVVEAQEADLVFVPDPTKEGREEALGLLGRITATRCLLEAFHQAPGREQVLDCYRKQLNLHHRYVRENDGASQPVPDLWVLSAGKPETALRELGFAPAPDWAEGVYFNGQRYQPAWIVAISELPPLRQTLLVRLLGAGRVLARAQAELRTLPAESLVRHVALDLIVGLRLEVGQRSLGLRSREDEEWSMISDFELADFKLGIYREGEAKGLRDGQAMGEARGEAKALLAILTARGLSVTDEQRQQILSMDVATLDRLLVRSISVATTAELLH